MTLTPQSASLQELKPRNREHYETGCCNASIRAASRLRACLLPKDGLHANGDSGEKSFVLIPQQVLLHLAHGVARQLLDHKALLRDFEVGQL